MYFVHSYMFFLLNNNYYLGTGTWNWRCVCGIRYGHPSSRRSEHRTVNLNFKERLSRPMVTATMEHSAPVGQICSKPVIIDERSTNWPLFFLTRKCASVPPRGAKQSMGPEWWRIKVGSRLPPKRTLNRLHPTECRHLHIMSPSLVTKTTKILTLFNLSLVT